MDLILAQVDDYVAHTGRLPECVHVSNSFYSSIVDDLMKNKYAALRVGWTQVVWQTRHGSLAFKEDSDIPDEDGFYLGNDPSFWIDLLARRILMEDFT